MGRGLRTDATISVIHSTKLWLPQTMTWLYTQVVNLPPRVTNCVVCEEALNLDQFEIPNCFVTRGGNLFSRALHKQSWRYAEWSRARCLGACVSSFGSNILHSHFGDYGYADISNARRHGLQHVVTFYGYDASRLPHRDPTWKDRFAEMFDTVSLCLCEGPHMADTISELGCPDEKIIVHHLGINVAAIRFSPRSWKPGETLRFLIAGSFTEKKGFPYAIEALGRLKGRYDLELTVIGDDNGTSRMISEKQSINRAIDRAGLRKCTRMLGKMPYTALLDQAYEHHIFLQPSIVASDGDTEGGAPVTIIDMLATGMPVVATTHCDIPEVVPESHQKMLAVERNVDDLEAKIEWLIENPRILPQLIADGRHHVEQEFNARIQGERLARIYEGLVS